jgi:hypothetical protein
VTQSYHTEINNISENVWPTVPKLTSFLYLTLYEPQLPTLQNYYNQKVCAHNSHPENFYKISHCVTLSSLTDNNTIIRHCVTLSSQLYIINIADTVWPTVSNLTSLLYQTQSDPQFQPWIQFYIRHPVTHSSHPYKITINRLCMTQSSHTHNIIINRHCVTQRSQLDIISISNNKRPTVHTL